MKIAYLFLSIAFVLGQFQEGFGSDFDEKLESLARKTANEISNEGKLRVAVWDFVGENGESSSLGKYIAADFSIHLTNYSKGFKVMDRHHLNQILEEHKLNMQGFIDQETAKEVGMLSAVDAIVTGTVIVLEKEIKVRVKVLDTETALQIAAKMDYLSLDDRLKPLIDEDCVKDQVIRAQRSTASKGKSIGNRTRSSSVTSKRRGDLYFDNRTNKEVTIHIFRGRRRMKLMVKAGTIGSLHELKPGNYKFGIYLDGGFHGEIFFVGHSFADIQGVMPIEAGKSKTYVID